MNCTCRERKISLPRIRCPLPSPLDHDLLRTLYLPTNIKELVRRKTDVCDESYEEV